jgi:hypothetical protein
MHSGGYSLILDIYNNEKNFVFDLAAGAFTSRSMNKASKEIRKIAKKNSKIVGLLPYKNKFKSVFLLFSRERKRIHFKNTNKFKLFLRTFKKYSHIKNTLLKNSHFIIYTKKKTPKKISEEILKKINF